VGIEFGLVHQVFDGGGGTATGLVHKGFHELLAGLFGAKAGDLFKSLYRAQMGLGKFLLLLFQVLAQTVQLLFLLVQLVLFAGCLLQLLVEGLFFLFVLLLFGGEALLSGLDRLIFALDFGFVLGFELDEALFGLKFFFLSEGFGFGFRFEENAFGFFFGFFFFAAGFDGKNEFAKAQSGSAGEQYTEDELDVHGRCGLTPNRSDSLFLARTSRLQHPVQAEFKGLQLFADI